MDIGNRVLVTGGAGFIGSHITEFLLEKGYEVVVMDHLSTGRLEFLSEAFQSSRFKFINGDLLDEETLSQAMSQVGMVFHLAANADVRFGTDHPDRDLTQNTIATFRVLEAMRKNGVKKIAFSSTGSVYGEALQFPTPEDAAFPIQTSLYGASKAAGEGLISAYCEGFGFQGWIFRFVSILGERYTHGHVIDFVKQLREHPERLYVLGNGEQKKSYLYVKDCVNAIWTAVEKAEKKVNIFNLGTNEYVTVNESIRSICEQLGLSPSLTYSGGDRGWIGDNPFIFLDCQKIRKLGWAPTLTISESVKKTVRFLEEFLH